MPVVALLALGEPCIFRRHHRSSFRKRTTQTVPLNRNNDPRLRLRMHACMHACAAFRYGSSSRCLERVTPRIARQTRGVTTRTTAREYFPLKLSPKLGEGLESIDGNRNALDVAGRDIHRAVHGPNIPPRACRACLWILFRTRKTLHSSVYRDIFGER